MLARSEDTGETEHKMTRGHRGRLYGPRTAMLTFALLAGCAAPSPTKPNEAEVKEFAQQGYFTDEQYSVTTTSASWGDPKSSFEINLTVPTKPGPFPLIIYLPGLGETCSAGDFWRSAWAKGGYAVLSIQPLAEDARAWSSAEARSGDFSILARERYSGKVMAARINALQSALTELMLRHDRKEPPIDRVDASQVAVAGYDLGAYTAMVIAGESIGDSHPIALPMPVKAVIALSPYADFSGAPFVERYGGIHMAVLSITGQNDGDPLGIVAPPEVRKAPFEYMPSGGKYLLTLSGISHQTLAGGEIKQQSEKTASKEEANLIPSQDSEPRGRRRSRSKNPTGPRISGKQPSLTTQAIAVTSIQSVTTAFLDAYLKNDPIAREWLEKNAPQWIKNHGEIKNK